MKKKKMLFICVCCMLLLVACGRKKEVPEKTTITASAIYPYYNLEEAVKEATTIVHGTVNAKSETIVEDIKSEEGEKIGTGYHREVEIQVIDCLKGDLVQEFVTYVELGGETEDTIYICTDVKPVQEGEEVLIFLNEAGRLISPAVLFSVEGDQQIRVGKDVFPYETEEAEKEEEEKPYYSTLLPLEEYCNAIRAYVEAQE